VDHSLAFGDIGRVKRSKLGGRFVGEALHERHFSAWNGTRAMARSEHDVLSDEHG
jgi:hypothetical protein